MTTLAASIALAIAGSYSNALDINSVNYPLNFGPNYTFTDGSGAGQASKVFTDLRTLAASATEDLDLNGTTLLDAFGNAIAFTKIKGIIVVADAANTNDVVVGGAAANGFISPFGAATDKVKVRPGGMLVLVDPGAAGYAVTAATADLLRIGNGGAGTSVNYQIFLIGA
jgi:hypothetical protein